MAVPHVVGVASLLWEKDIAADAELIRMVLNAGQKHTIIKKFMDMDL